MILGEVKARPKDIISFSLDYISKSKVQTSNPSSSPISLDTPARPADYITLYLLLLHLLYFSPGTCRILHARNGILRAGLKLSDARCGHELCSGSLAEVLLASSKSLIITAFHFSCGSLKKMYVSPPFHTFLVYPGAISFPSTSGF